MAWDFWIYYLLLHFFSFFMLLIITNWNIILCVVVSVKEYHTWNPPFNVLTTLIYAISYWDFCIYFREVEKQKWQDPQQRRLFFLGHWRYDALLCLLSVKSVDHYLISSVTYQLTILIFLFSIFNSLGELVAFYLSEVCSWVLSCNSFVDMIPFQHL